MSIMLMTDNPNRSKPWRAKYGGKVEYFQTEEAAEAWELGQKRTQIAILDTEILSKHTVGDLIRRYMQDKEGTLSRPGHFPSQQNPYLPSCQCNTC